MTDIATDSFDVIGPSVNGLGADGAIAVSLAAINTSMMIYGKVDIVAKKKQIDVNSEIHYT